MIEDEMYAIARIARLCHEVNRGICAAQGDDSQMSWREAPSWQKESAINGVRYTLANLNASPEDSHINWMREKVMAGWVYGEKKDPNANPPTHPCIVPYGHLPFEQRVKDYVFQAIVRAEAERLGL